MQDDVSDDNNGSDTHGARRAGERREISVRRGDMRWDPLKKERRLGYDRRETSELPADSPPVVKP